MNVVRRWVGLLLVVASVLPMMAPGCRGKKYDQSSAAATVRSMQEMIKDGNAHQLPTLIKAENEDMQRLLEQARPIIDRMHKLGIALQEKYPDEFDALVERGVAAGKEKFNEVTNQRPDGEQWRDRVTLLIADPFGMLDREMTRVDTEYVSDDTYALTIDGKPAFGVGLLIRRDIETRKWFFEVPDTIPGLSAQLPKSDAEWRITSAMLKSVANGVEWTERKITDEKDAGTLEEIWAELAINVAPNLVIQWGIYESVVKRRKEREKAAKAEPGN
jgi:hypothetical protein